MYLVIILLIIAVLVEYLELDLKIVRLHSRDRNSFVLDPIKLTKFW